MDRMVCVVWWYGLVPTLFSRMRWMPESPSDLNLSSWWNCCFMKCRLSVASWSRRLWSFSRTSVFSAWEHPRNISSARIHGEVMVRLCKEYGFHELYEYCNTLKPRENRCHFAGDIFKWICLYAWNPITMSLKFVSKGPNNNILALVQIMAWCRPGDKSLYWPMMVSLLSHICVTRPQWAKQQN